MKLKELRKDKNLSQQQVADSSKISRAAYSNIENGVRKPSVDTAKKIADVLDFDWTEFYKNSQAG